MAPNLMSPWVGHSLVPSGPLQGVSVGNEPSWTEYTPKMPKNVPKTFKNGSSEWLNKQSLLVAVGMDGRKPKKRIRIDKTEVA